MAQPLFGIVPTGLPVLTQPTEAPSATSFLYSIPSSTDRSFSHVVVFLLPGIELPQGTAAAIYLVTPPNTAAGQTAPSSRFLGGIGPGKESAIFKIGQNATPGASTVIGISVEEAGSVATRIEEVRAQSSSKALVPSGGSGAGSGGPTTLVLAQRIIQNAFNFLASFSSGGNGRGAGGEVVPLRAFEEWWRKFEGRVRSDPTFLERAQE